ncbi:Rqc2 family fibronectin-binding protein [Thermaerobacter subterraneus]|uniref:Rqc2 homolog RqcH n=1 Tax=Thermaerobacter subterraneus DSM 13965 TaxID=867903 RepID=K6Q420_9FIRM|nr:NFACT RNA binding domain-containing protein [Thermaerobacter subterraneus]EKP95874.1 putative RNA-binding protein, snRNP like protein [Thermaerobacter subterraneus DSM 13965]
MNGLVLAAVLQELSSLLPARVERIYQPEPHLLVLRLYAGREVHLLIGADPSLPRLHLTARPPANPPAPPAFCMLLRKHLESLRLVAAHQGPAFDRWVQLAFVAPGPDEPARRRYLIVELLERRANVVLTDGEGRILDALRRTPDSASRSLLPGSRYQPPPAPTPLPDGDAGSLGRTWLEAVTAPGPEAAAGRSRGSRPAWRRLLEQVPVLGRELAQEALHRAGLDPATGKPLPAEATAVPEGAGRGETLARVVLGWLEAARQGRFDPVLVRDPAGAAIALTAFPVTPPPGGRLERPQGALWPLCDTFYRERLDALTRQRLRQQLEQLLREALGRARRRLEAREEDFERTEQAEPYRIYGELLTAFASQVPRGAREVTLPNYYDPQGATVTIPLDPALSPQENAQRYFRLYQKARRGREQAAALLEAAREEVAYLESVEQALAEAVSAGDLEAIAAELAEQGYAPAFANLAAQPLPAAKGSSPRGADPGRGRDRGPAGPAAAATTGVPLSRARRAGDGGAGFLRYRGPGGELILAGRNNRQNDALVTRVANPWDIWLHARQVPGSHVLLRLAHREAEPSPEALEAAARVAAYHSRARSSGRVAVDYTEARHVRKPKGARPGFVRYEYARTLFVSPDPEGLPPRLDGASAADRGGEPGAGGAGDGDGPEKPGGDGAPSPATALEGGGGPAAAGRRRQG